MNNNKVLELMEYVIDNEFGKATEEYNPYRESKEYVELSNKSNAIWKEVFESVPEGKRDLLYKLMEISTDMLCIESKHYFREGVKKGLTDLKYLQEFNPKNI